MHADFNRFFCVSRQWEPDQNASGSQTATLCGRTKSDSDRVIFRSAWIRLHPRRWSCFVSALPDFRDCASIS